MTPTQSVFGIDGCRAGWICARLDDAGRSTIELATDTVELAELVGKARLALVDIPIGLLDGGREERPCDRAARAMLGRPRASSVFRAPARAALAAGDFASANALNRQATGVGLGRQCFGILPKIREVDELLRTHETLGGRLRESHPEVCFQALNAGRAMAHNKKTSDGQAERRRVVERHLTQSEDLIASAWTRYPRAMVSIDDILDALILGVSARQLAATHGSLPTLPHTPPRDVHGLRMEIVYPGQAS